MPNDKLTIVDGFNPKGQSKLILSSSIVRYVKPTLFSIDESKASTEQDAAIPDKTSWLSTPVYDIVRILPFTYTNSNDETIEISDNVDLDTVLMEISQPRNIVKTMVQGGEGTVKEFISNGDYEISIIGVITSKYANISPFEAEPLFITQLRDALNANVSIPVSGNFFSVFDIKNIVVERYSLKQVEGARNAWEISIDAVSDEPFEIKYSGPPKYWE